MISIEIKCISTIIKFELQVEVMACKDMVILDWSETTKYGISDLTINQ
jgi:hypothetical protein